MGNWRRVHITGTCDENEVEALRRAVVCDRQTFDALDGTRFHCLMHTGGIAGLPSWPAKTVCATGNMAERGYDEESVQETLELLAKVAPSLKCKVHLAGDHETDACVATVTLEGGLVIVDKPEMSELPRQGEAQMKGHLAQLRDRSRPCEDELIEANTGLRDRLDKRENEKAVLVTELTRVRNDLVRRGGQVDVLTTDIEDRKQEASSLYKQLASIKEDREAKIAKLTARAEVLDGRLSACQDLFTKYEVGLVGPCAVAKKLGEILEGR